MPSPEPQTQPPTGLCYPRGRTHDDSAFIAWFVPTILHPQPGEHILDLACGTGSITFAASLAVGTKGSVVGIDAREAMVEAAETKLRHQRQQQAEDMGHVRFLRHDVVDLGSCSGLSGCEGQFDAVICMSVLGLLEDAEAAATAVKGWVRFLKPGGRIVLDALHERSSLFGLCLERTFERTGLAQPHHRNWLADEENFRKLLRKVGLTVEEVVLRKQRDVDSVRRVEEGDVLWDETIGLKVASELKKNEEMLQKTKEVFKEEWSKLADGEGSLYDVYREYIARARKPYDSFPNTEILATGSCACSAIKWTSTALPFELTFCHCVSCRKASGGAFQAFLDFETDAVTFDIRYPAAMKNVELSKNAKRSFCFECGSSMTMQYNVDPEEIGVCAGSLDESSIKGGIMALNGIRKKHIFVKDKVWWYDIPNDGYERQEHMKNASRLLIHND